MSEYTAELAALVKSGIAKFAVQGWSVVLATEQEIRENNDSSLSPQEKNALIMEHRRLTKRKTMHSLQFTN